MDDDMVQVVGMKAGVAHVLGTATMPPRMKARELVTEMFGPIDEEIGNDAAMAFWCCERLMEFLAKPQVVSLTAPAPTPKEP